VTEVMKKGNYTIEVLVQGYPGKTVCHGGLGWSTIALLQTRNRIILIDVGSFSMRRILIERLAARGLAPEDVTDVLLTHSHYDHSLNWVTFPTARIMLSGAELDWADDQPFGRTIVPELYIRELLSCGRLVRLTAGDEVLPELVAHGTPGHTPGHLTYVLTAGEQDVIFTGDAAKNRAELLCRRADLTLDPVLSTRSMEAIWELWRRRPGSVLIPGHDVPMILRNGEPHYIAERQGGIRAMVGTDIEQTRLFDLTF
jgi:N-acyl homoserine lactone hydrolase